jgi:hypothetical protein
MAARVELMRDTYSRNQGLGGRMWARKGSSADVKLT